MKCDAGSGNRTRTSFRKPNFELEAFPTEQYQAALDRTQIWGRFDLVLIRPGMLAEKLRGTLRGRVGQDHKAVIPCSTIPVNITVSIDCRHATQVSVEYFRTGREEALAREVNHALH